MAAMIEGTTNGSVNIDLMIGSLFHLYRPRTQAIGIDITKVAKVEDVACTTVKLVTPRDT